MPDHRSGSRLEGRTCLVTGATGGIGSAVALALAAEGARVHCVGRDESSFAELLERAGAERVVAERLDLTSTTDREALVARLLDSPEPRLDCLVHCAGIIEHATLAESSASELEAMLEVNLKVPWLLTRALLPALVASPADIVVVNSSVTRFPRAYSGQYAMTQHGLLGFTESLRAELNEEGVRVLSVFPGRTATSTTRRLTEAEGRSYRAEALLQPEAVASMILSAILLPRTAEVTDLYLRPAIKD